MTEDHPALAPAPEPQRLRHDAAALTAWLTTLVRNRDNGTLAELRRARVRTNAHIRAGWYGGDDHRDLFEQVAFLFAIYHQGRPLPSYGIGSLGAAARRIGDGTGRGPDNPGAQRLLDRIVASRRVPWRHLQHAVTRLRSCDQPPPSWTGLTEDLIRWNDRKARIAYRWSVEFHTPPVRNRDTSNEPRTRRDTTS
ncbi:type I-E CRISPR-associated protein Cse2/CasB [Actinacidiphila guanduensis]|uniref:CRISPR system Cascade subunit CasA n=1 Tax=Actinacidiphila guanduensis TaxID=310781 RepID=A0A1G9W0N0_9ACTN|nr:type I-E CRISPR-associated protein Cse2/CasB [Actinacidiphila guanduensis]SDM78062.1 CRISPR system Cascade subunit CasA [Actinacidiphila guanduensis]